MSGDICFICRRRMLGRTIPYWLLDLEQGTVKGKIHKTCREKLPLEEHRKTMRVEGDPPPRDVILFGRRMLEEASKLDSLPRAIEKNSTLKYLILSYTFLVSNVEDLLKLPRLVSLFDYWVHGSKIITEEELKEIKTWVREVLS